MIATAIDLTLCFTLIAPFAILPFAIAYSLFLTATDRH